MSYISKDLRQNIELHSHATQYENLHYYITIITMKTNLIIFRLQM